MKTQFFKKGTKIIEEGTLSDCAYIIESGRVQVSKTLNNGKDSGFRRLHNIGDDAGNV